MSDNALELLTDPNWTAVIQSYIRTSETRRREALGFNVFSLVSDHYYRENFHSDVLQAFLDMDGKHGGGPRYLHQFIRLLEEVDPDIAPLLKCEEFEKYSTKREDGRIDVLIVDEDSGKAIIIENKINGAGDQERQLPRYLEDVQQRPWHRQPDKTYKVVAIVYLSMDGHKMPDYDWTREEKAAVDAVLIPVGAYTNDDSRPDLVTRWLGPCIEEPTNDKQPTIAPCLDREDARAILRQYSRLLRFQGANTMNNAEMTAFYDLLIKENKYEQVKTIEEMLVNIRAHFIERYAAEYRRDPKKCSPFAHVVADINGLQLQFVGWDCGGADGNIVLWGTFVGEMKIVWSFLDRRDLNHQSKEVEEVLHEAGLLNAYSENTEPEWPGRFQSRRLGPPTSRQGRDEILEFLDKTLEKLRGVQLPKSACGNPEGA